MLTRVVPRLAAVRRCILHTRNISVSAPALQKADIDPIQQLFLSKIKEYAEKKKASGGKLVDASPAQMKAYQEQLDNLSKQYQVGTQDFTQFPTFNFTDPELSPSSAGFQPLHLQGERDVASLVEEEEDPDVPFFGVQG